MESRGAVDIFKWNLFLATDVVGELSFGESFKTLENGAVGVYILSALKKRYTDNVANHSTQKNQYLHFIESIGPLGAIRSAFPTLTTLAFIMPFPVFKSAANASKAVRRYAEESLGRYYKLASSDENAPPSTLFSKLHQSEEDGEITFEEILANASGYIIAGSDTTASTLTYLIWSVCRQSDIKAELLRQLQTLPPDFDDDDLRKIPYLSHVIDETLRLYTAAQSGLVRETPAEGAVLGGFQLDGGTVVCAQSYSMHRDLAAFPDPETFDPRRWESSSKVMMDAYMPFGRGPRGLSEAHLQERH